MNNFNIRMMKPSKLSLFGGEIFIFHICKTCCFQGLFLKFFKVIGIDDLRRKSVFYEV